MLLSLSLSPRILFYYWCYPLSCPSAFLLIIRLLGLRPRRKRHAGWKISYKAGRGRSGPPWIKLIISLISEGTVTWLLGYHWCYDGVLVRCVLVGGEGIPEGVEAQALPVEHKVTHLMNDFSSLFGSAIARWKNQSFMDSENLLFHKIISFNNLAISILNP